MKKLAERVSKRKVRSAQLDILKLVMRAVRKGELLFFDNIRLANVGKKPVFVKNRTQPYKK